MKKTLLVLTAVLLFLIPVCAGVFLNGAPFYASSCVEPIVNSGTDTVVDPTNIGYSRAERMFRKMFPAATGIKWTKMPNALMVEFESDGSRGNVVMSEKGKLRYSLQAVPVEKFPTHLQKKVGDQYPGYSFFDIKKVRNKQATSMFVVIENKKEYLSLIINEDGMDELQHLQKSSDKQKAQ